ncbi:MAG: type VII secretion integral membrane protein EccD, partial [Tomitella sp.]|nr:type VII secretion integral membrane protein EccD [Tomitella sp.]
MDIVLPAAVPVAALIPELVDLTMSRRPAIAAPADHNDPDGTWILGRVGHPPLDHDRSLADQSVVDGALLHLQRSAVAEPEPLFDDIIDAVAVAGTARFAQWGADT